MKEGYKDYGTPRKVRGGRGRRHHRLRALPRLVQARAVTGHQEKNALAEIRKGKEGSRAAGMARARTRAGAGA